jgi:competence protein ComEC
MGETQSDFGSALLIHRPLLGVIVCFSLGTAAGLRTEFPVILVLGMAAVLFLFGATFLRRSVSTFFLWGAVFFTGWAHAALSVQAVSGRELRNLMSRPQENFGVVGIVSYEPLLRPGRWDGEEIREFVFRVEAVRREGSWQRSRGDIAARWKTDRNVRAIRYGERWMLSGLVTVTKPAPMQFNRPRYTLNVEPAEARYLSGGHGASLISWCLRGRRACFDILGRGLENFPEQAGLLRALILGYRQELPDELYRSFSLTGTLHVVAISGMHVAVLALLFMAFLKALGFSRPYWVIFLAPALVLYTMATGMSASAVRACVMAIVFWSAPLFSRKPDGPSALAVAALLILAFVPTQLFDMGFLLSFIAVAGLMTLYPMWMRPVHAALAVDPWRIQPERFWKRWGRLWGMETASLVVASTAAWLVTTPLSAGAFNVVSPVGLIGNLLVIPLSSLVLLTGVLSLVAGSLSVFLAEIFNHANCVFISILIAWVNWTAGIPGGHVFIPSPSALWVAGWYGALIVLLVTYGTLRRAIVVIAVATLAVGVCRGVRDDTVRVDILDVGRGNATLIDVPGSGDVLLDAGPRFSGRNVVRYLRKRGVGQLESLILTHGDADHIGGAFEILKNVPVSELWCAPFVRSSLLYRKLLGEAAKRTIRIRRLEQGDHGVLGGGVEWEVLSPSGNEVCGRADEGSLVIRIARGAAAVLFMGGADGAVEPAILRRPVDPAADILVVGNHGAAGVCSDPFLAAVDPSSAIISVGADNTEGQPDPGVLSRLAERGIEVWRTDESGHLRITFAPEAEQDPPCEVFAISPNSTQ